MFSLSRSLPNITNITLMQNLKENKLNLAKYSRPIVRDGEADRFNKDQLFSKTEKDHLEEEDRRPEGRDAHVGERLWKSHKGQDQPRLHHVIDRLLTCIGQKAKYGEDEDGRDEVYGGVDAEDNGDVLDEVVLLLVEAPKCNQ